MLPRDFPASSAIGFMKGIILRKEKQSLFQIQNIADKVNNTLVSAAILTVASSNRASMLPLCTITCSFLVHLNHSPCEF